MDKYNNIKKYNATTFKSMTEISPSTFEEIIGVTKTTYANKHKLPFYV